MAIRMAAAACALVCVLAAASTATASPAERAMLDRLNEVRQAHGLRALRPSSSLERSAGSYARFILRTGYFGHLARIRASGRFRSLGENLAWHSGRSPRVGFTVRAWMNSPPHRAVILSPLFRWLGAGLARGRLGGRVATVWVLHAGG
ncbi:MAG TPA: CAP domain-containing protein [Thermoleophilaceae bacterium]|jgi:uncharacterized protein YkwD